MSSLVPNPRTQVRTGHPTSDPNALLTLDVAAELVCCCARTLRRRIAEGTIPAYRLGRLLRVRKSDLMAAFTPITSAPTGLDDFITRQTGG